MCRRRAGSTVRVLSEVLWRRDCVFCGTGKGGSSRGKFRRKVLNEQSPQKKFLNEEGSISSRAPPMRSGGKGSISSRSTPFVQKETFSEKNLLNKPTSSSSQRTFPLGTLYAIRGTICLHRLPNTSRKVVGEGVARKKISQQNLDIGAETDVYQTRFPENHPSPYAHSLHL